MNDERTRVRLDTGGGDPEEARHRLAVLYNGEEWSALPTDSAFSYRYAALGDAAMTLRTSRMTGDLQGAVGVTDEVVVQWIVAGRATVDDGQEPIALVHGRPQLFPVGRSFAFEYVDYEQKLVHLGRSAVEKVAAERGLLGPLRFDHRARPTADAVQHWRRAVSASAQALRSERVSHLLWDELTRGTVSALLELYPPEAAVAPPELLLPRNARLRTAVEFIHAHASEPIGPTEVAASAGLSVRGLQSAFQRVLDVRPIAYIRLVRLDAAHAELAAADPRTRSVTEIAHAWGFGNPGRFSSAYLARFGEYPSATLQR
ncbi:AraC family transcriptional regulator [Rathayibacter sp. SD072]|uniref:AraC family transcriptional regulator n=1 Tax=Rathayibacter sp. SD072 TaxID=2781731 RepID=UPI001A96D831|nr:AraC family transcriptional regulator [Rathayibacter sp. SD072]MBO0984751.1 helix-turn-helix transcriptional regulator [Rathayibacter sp. SD072]